MQHVHRKSGRTCALRVPRYDYHPHDHCSFLESANSGATAIVSPSAPYAPFTMVTLKADQERAEHEQAVYARHCVQGSWGAECHQVHAVHHRSGEGWLHMHVHARHLPHAICARAARRMYMLCMHGRD